MSTIPSSVTARTVLCTIDEASARIRAGGALLLAASEGALRQLPHGQWIGGTIPYFMAQSGGCYAEDRVLVTALPQAARSTIRLYDEASLPHMPADAPRNGFTVLIVPSGSAVHRRYAEEASTYESLFLSPIVGWVAGTALDQIGAITPKVIDGQAGTMSDTCAVAMHIPLPERVTARVGIVNIFTQGDGDVLRFPQTGFTVTDCLVNGEPRSFAAYLAERSADTRLPLVADYHGALINTSFQDVDAVRGRVTCYAPVFAGIDYRLARPVGDYAAAFKEAVPREAAEAVFACNCILNYLYGDLEGKQVGLAGPITFGEIAYQLVNQTLVYLVVEDA